MHILIAVAVILGIAWVFWDKSNEMFLIRVVNGGAWVARGDVSGDFLHHVERVAKNPFVRNGTVRGVKKETGVVIQANGFTEGQAQRIRNAYNLSPQARFRSKANPVNEKNFWRTWNVAHLLRVLMRW